MIKPLLAVCCGLASFQTVAQAPFAGISGGISVTSAPNYLSAIGSSAAPAWVLNVRGGVSFGRYSVGVQAGATPQARRITRSILDVTAQRIGEVRQKLYIANPSYSALGFAQRRSGIVTLGVLAGFSFAPENDIDEKAVEVEVSGAPYLVPTRVALYSGWSGFTAGVQAGVEKEVGKKFAVIGSISALATFASTRDANFRLLTFPVTIGLQKAF